MGDFYDTIQRDISLFVYEEVDEYNKKLNDADFVLLYSPEKRTAVEPFGILAKEYAVVMTKEAIIKTGVPEKVFIFLLSGEMVKRYLADMPVGKMLAADISSEIGRVIMSIIKDYNFGMDKHMSVHHAFDLLVAIASYDLNHIHDSESQLVKDACTLIETEYNTLYGVEDLADRLNISKSHLIRVFKREKKITPGAYLEEIRMENARRFLSDPNVSLKIAAGLSGYANENYFSKVFKRVNGISPKVFQRMNASTAKEYQLQIPDEYYL